MNSIKSWFSEASNSDTAQIVNDTLGVNNNEEEGSMCPTMDLSTRIQAFAFTFGIGIILSIGGTINLWLVNYPAFAILYSLGSIVSIVSSMFLRGPMAQLKAMADPTRAIATVAMLFFICLTLIAGLVWKNAGLCLLFFICQYLASLWYMLSYIPFARDAVKKCCGALVA